MVVTTTSTSGQRLEDDGEETDPIRLYFQSSISQQCAYVCSRSTSSLSPPMTCRHPCYRLLRCRAVITKNMSRKNILLFWLVLLNGTTDLFCQVTLPDVLHFVQWLLAQCFANIYVSFLRTQSQIQLDFRTINRLHFLSFHGQIHSFGLFCIQWQPNLSTFYLHIAQKLPGLPNLIRQKNDVISKIKVS